MMRGVGPRSARAKRRSQARHQVPEHAPIPAGWPDGSSLAETLDLNPLAVRLLDEMKPEVMRTILQRLDVQLRKTLLDPHNIPVTKVSIRAASQVLTLLRAEDKPAESKLLGSLLSPAADLFNDAWIGSPQLTGLQLKLADLALPLFVHSESTFKGLRTWHRWCEDDFEDITLVAVVGQHCSYAALAASYLAFSYPEIAQRYESLRAEHPDIPPVAEGRLTSSNPLTRYLAARPDRKLPSTVSELRSLLHEDTRTRQAELAQARRQRQQAHDQLERRTRQRDDALTRRRDPQETSPPSPLAEPSDPRLDALPGVAEWAAAVTDSRALTQRLINGDPPDMRQLQSIIDLSLRVANMAAVTSRVLEEKVNPNRGDIDRALTVILSDSALTQKLGSVPRTVAEVAEALQRLSPDGEPAAASPESIPDAAEAPPQNSEGGKTTAATQTPQPSEPETSEPDVAEQDDKPLDLSDLDSILNGEVGARLSALAGPSANLGSGRIPVPKPRPASEIDADELDDDTDSVAEAEPPPDPEADELAQRLVAAATWARHPGGPLSNEYATCMSQLDIEQQLDPDPVRRLIVAASALPMALLDPASGANKLLNLDVPELTGWPGIVELRRLIAEFTRNGGSLYAPDMQRQAHMSRQLMRIRYRAKQLRDTAATRTLKYDKATKVYRAWFTPGGRLRPLLDCLDTNEFGKLQVLVDDAAKVEAVRAINETVTELFDKGKPRIVAGARQTLVDAYEEVVSLGTGAMTVRQGVIGGSHSGHDAHRRFQRASDFVGHAQRQSENIEADLTGAQPPPEEVVVLVKRAMSFHENVHPLAGPEPSIDWVLAQQLEPSGETT